MKNLEKAVLAVLLGKQVDEALKGGQVKLDKNKNNKLDAEDFKMLRGEKPVKEEALQVFEQEEDNVTANVVGHKVTLHRHLSEPGESDTYTLHHPSGAKKVKISFEKHGDGSEVHGEKVNHAFGLEAKHKLGHKIASSMNGMGGISKFEESVELKAGEELDEMSKSMAYATGTKKAMQMSGDEPPLEKSTIKKAHSIAKAMLRKEEVEDQFADYDELIEAKPFEYEVQENYNFGDYLKTAKQLVGEEEAINLANNAFNAKDTDLFLEAVGRSDIEAKVKMHSAAGHKVSTPKYSTKGGEFHAEYVVTDKESGIRRKYIHHGSSRKVENMGAAGKRD